MKPPFYILCFPRSGSTLLAAMLDRHPNISMSPELNGLWSSFPYRLKFYGDLMNSFNLKLALNDLIHIGGQLRFFKTKVKSKKLYEKLKNNTEINLKNIIETLYQTILESNCKSQIGEQTPDHTQYLNLINNTFPNAKIIHLIRDGRDCALSQMKLRNDYNIYKAATLWNDFNKILNIFGKKFEDRYLCIKYESLISNTDEILKEICHFLNETYHPGMLQYSLGDFAVSNTKMANGHSNLARNIIKNNYYKWKTKCSSNELKIFESIASKTLTYYDYDTVNNYGGLSWKLLKNQQYIIMQYHEIIKKIKKLNKFIKFVVIVTIKRIFKIYRVRDLCKNKFKRH